MISTLGKEGQPPPWLPPCKEPWAGLVPSQEALTTGAGDEAPPATPQGPVLPQADSWMLRRMVIGPQRETSKPLMLQVPLPPSCQGGKGSSRGGEMLSLQPGGPKAEAAGGQASGASPPPPPVPHLLAFPLQGTPKATKDVP